MTQEEKSLLIQDLSARLPYGVKVRTNRGSEIIEGLAPFCHNQVKIALNLDWSLSIYDYIPYLRPMSSMTEEEWEEYDNFCDDCRGAEYFELIDWLNNHHFDYRGLIERGLAIAVTEENNPYTE